jgi:hypothetical protein
MVATMSKSIAVLGILVFVLLPMLWAASAGKLDEKESMYMPLPWKLEEANGRGCRGSTSRIVWDMQWDILEI